MAVARGYGVKWRWMGVAGCALWVEVDTRGGHVFLGDGFHGHQHFPSAFGKGDADGLLYAAGWILYGNTAFHRDRSGKAIAKFGRRWPHTPGCLYPKGATQPIGVPAGDGIRLSLGRLCI